MPSLPEIIILTGDRLRHKYFAARILDTFDSAKLLVEKHPIPAWGAHVQQATPLVREHFLSFQRTESDYFKDFVKVHAELLASRTLMEINTGEINRPDIIAYLQALQPKVFAVLSTSLLQAGFIEAFPRRLINYHAGLSPYYRGSATNVFPFLNDELQYVGVTIHYIDAGIDSGDIIIQGRPVFEPGDDTHTIGCKTLMVGTELMVETLRSFLAKGPPKGHRQSAGEGRLYKKSDFNDEVILELRAQLEKGVVKSYAAEQPQAIQMVSEISYA